MIEADDKRLRFVSIDKATQPKDGFCMIYKDRWWSTHPEKGILFWSSSPRSRAPQCNENKAITQDLVTKLYPWAVVVFLPWVFEATDPKDWM